MGRSSGSSDRSCGSSGRRRIGVVVVVVGAVVVVARVGVEVVVEV